MTLINSTLNMGFMVPFLARKFTDGIVGYKEFQKIVFQDQEDCDIELSAFVGLEQLYDSICLIYQVLFANIYHDHEDASVHAPLSGMVALYHFFETASANKYALTKD
ncbi:hypothetical protein EDC96DRAFT_542101 [Choanephora cucurbitarum]|nr:hypothetical protein EDC96DRAFT_542101 [Choanephora cucurbitarum]